MSTLFGCRGLASAFTPWTSALAVAAQQSEASYSESRAVAAENSRQVPTKCFHQSPKTIGWTWEFVFAVFLNKVLDKTCEPVTILLVAGSPRACGFSSFGPLWKEAVKQESYCSTSRLWPDEGLKAGRITIESRKKYCCVHVHAD